MTREQKQQALDVLWAKCILVDVCPQLAATATQLVRGHGNINADIVLIGEAPGRSEDQTGKPFQGAAGKFLNELLASISLQREDIYITNIVKYRPPNNRDPQPDEKAAFWPYLRQELDIIQPKLVVTLGRHPLSAFVPGARISEVHGQIMQPTTGQYTFSVLSLYHPAAAIYNQSLRQTLFEDCRGITDFLSKN
jgi:uracil-DNA glycosylase